MSAAEMIETTCNENASDASRFSAYARECLARYMIDGDKRDAIAEFVWHFEPTKPLEGEWRKMLQAALDEAYAKGRADASKG